MSSKLSFRHARLEDLETIVALFAEDMLGKTREDASLPLNSKYTDAFAEIDEDRNQHLLVGEIDGDVVAFLQITYIPNLCRLGSKRGNIESVHVASPFRSQGIGRQLMREAIRLCREQGCSLVQLTTDRQRSRALKFYRELGFEATHHGMKLVL